MELTEALLAEDAAMAVVGAGGKKTTMYALSSRLDRPVLTASVRIPIFDPHVSTVATTDDPVGRLADASPGEFPLGLIRERENGREDRYLGYDHEVVASIVDAHRDQGSVLIKADGARMREFKAPGEAEPQIPENVDVVVPIASVSVVGESLSSGLVHRPERVLEVARAAGIDLAIDDPVTPEVVAAVLASDRGGLKNVPEEARVVPLLNKVDDDEDAALAREIAGAFIERFEQRRATHRTTNHANPENGMSVPAVPHVVLGRLIDGVVVDVVPVDGEIPDGGSGA
ncbi:selenium cofactor biosynthesis protein YqeC [Halopenitus sp. H-Gu1]|uniref:selenium cofactor biosynthesis protein YqeC n=1 Tax=Halopenitus sp. H-Gu1 TaxID=3242697 RepID=UPI00359E5847